MLALGLAVLQNSSGAVPNALYHLGLFDAQRVRDAIATSIDQYNKNSAGFYATAGEAREGLAVIPASQLQKRRLFQDINMLKGEGLAMVFDMDSMQIMSTRLLNRTTAVARTKEVWAVALQDIRTRRPVFNVKAVEVEVRYLLHDERGPLGRRTWIIHEVDVYPKGEAVPELNIRRAL